MHGQPGDTHMTDTHKVTHALCYRHISCAGMHAHTHSPGSDECEIRFRNIYENK